jgi:hypothetical protein
LNEKSHGFTGHGEMKEYFNLPDRYTIVDKLHSIVTETPEGIKRFMEKHRSHIFEIVPLTPQMKIDKRITESFRTSVKCLVSKSKLRKHIDIDKTQSRITIVVSPMTPLELKRFQFQLDELSQIKYDIRDFGVGKKRFITITVESCSGIENVVRKLADFPEVQWIEPVLSVNICHMFNLYA